MNWPKYAFFWVLGVLCGILFLKISAFNFSYEVKLADILGVIVTLIVAFLIQLYLVKKSDVKKVEREIVIEQAKLVRERFANTRDKFYEFYSARTVSSDRSKQILSLLRSLANSIEIFGHSVAHLKVRSVGEPFQNVRRLYYSYKRELTGVDVRKPFSDYTFQASDKIFNDVNRELVSIILFVNRNQ